MNFDLDHKALAYPASNLPDNEPVTPCLCSLVFRCDNAKRATLLLVVSIPTADSTADSEFVLQYDGDNLMPDHDTLATGRGHLEPTQLDDLAPRSGKAKKRLDIKTLRLSTKRPPPLWCPASTPTFSPRPGHELALDCLEDLAKETKIHVVFDFTQLHQSYHSFFKAFCKAAQGLIGYPVDAPLLDRGLRTATWEVFAPTEVPGAPPAYNASRARKRSRQGTSTESFSSPYQLTRAEGSSSPPATPKAESYTTEKTESVSPETGAAALRQAQFDYHTNIHINSVVNDRINTIVDDRLATHIEKLKDLQAAAIDAAVAKHLDTYLGGPLHAKRVDAAADRQVNAAVEARLSDAVQHLLVPTDLPSSPATSFTYDVHGNPYPKLPPLTPMGRIFLPHLRAHLVSQFDQLQEQQLQIFRKRMNEMYDEVSASAEDNRRQERYEWDEERGDHADGISYEREKAIEELWQEGQKLIADGKEQCDERLDTLGADLADKLSGLVDRIENLNKYSVKKLVAGEVVRQWKKRRGAPKGFYYPKRSRRSLLTNPKLLGRKKRRDNEREDV
ncbi:hypothetical protein N0V86_007556 [Didymella sp. IMI 355093]|nr:hypothetical protein N0V86_007556 [Didymella sp. IMI 355093]